MILLPVTVRYLGDVVKVRYLGDVVKVRNSGDIATRDIATSDSTVFG